MEISSRKKYIFFGIFVFSILLTLSLKSFGTDTWCTRDYKEDRMKWDPKQDNVNRIPPDCHLPLQWTLRTNSPNSSKPLTVLHLKENDTCLGFLIEKHCYQDNLTIPNVVHYILFGKRPFKIYTFLSFLGTWKHVKPCFIVIFGDYPHGELFEKFLSYKPRIIFVPKKPKETIFGKKMRHIEHKADVARMEIIYKYGGIYLDHDVIPLKSIDPLRNHSFVLGQETGSQLGNSFILSVPSAFFMKIWMATYSNFNPSEWAEHSTVVPYNLVKLLPDMVYVSHEFFKPNYLQKDQIYNKTIDWSSSYSLHLYGKIGIQNDTLEDIRYVNSTYGSVARYIYYGDKTLQRREKKIVQKKKISHNETRISTTKHA